MTRLVPWDESIADATLRGATHLRRGTAAPPFVLLVREGDRARLRARSAGVFPVLLAVGALSSCHAWIECTGGVASQTGLLCKSWLEELALVKTPLSCIYPCGSAPSLYSGVKGTHPVSARE